MTTDGLKLLPCPFCGDEKPTARDLGPLLDRASDDNELLRAEVERLRGHSQAAAVNDDPSIGDAILAGIASDDSSALEQMIAIKTNLERAGFAIVRRAEIRKWDAVERARQFIQLWKLEALQHTDAADDEDCKKGHE